MKKNGRRYVIMEKRKKIHIVCFQTPYPADYGGAIDVYHKAKALKDAGCHVVLHCFEYGGRGYNDALLRIADEVFMYKRKTGLLQFLSFVPYIVKTRTSDSLLHNLLKDDAPILFEGTHTTALLNAPKLKHRKKFLRMHNIESEYYLQLGRASTSLIKKIFFFVESFKLRHYESRLKSADVIFAITEKDKAFLISLLPACKAVLLPCFHNGDCTEQSPAVAEDGKYILYNGNLGVEENARAVHYLMDRVVPLTGQAQWVFAGGKPHKSLVKKAESLEKVTIKSYPSDAEMDALIRGAAANVLITFQATGIKLKLLNALYKGGHCIVNDAMVESTGLADLCIVANSPQAIAAAIDEALRKPLAASELADRQAWLHRLYDNDNSIRVLLDFL